MTEQKMKVPLLYSETESVKKAGGNDFRTDNTTLGGGAIFEPSLNTNHERLLSRPLPDHAPGDKYNSGYYSSDMFRGVQEYFDDKYNKLSHSEWNQAMKPYQDAYMALENKVPSDILHKIGDTMRSESVKDIQDKTDAKRNTINAGDQIRYNNLMNRKKRRGKTAPKMASFDHECNIWGNNLAGNREFYEPVTKGRPFSPLVQRLLETLYDEGVLDDDIDEELDEEYENDIYRPGYMSRWDDNDFAKDINDDERIEAEWDDEDDEDEDPVRKIHSYEHEYTIDNGKGKKYQLTASENANSGDFNYTYSEKNQGPKRNRFE